jgi:hypothetical protein
LAFDRDHPFLPVILLDALVAAGFLSLAVYTVPLNLESFIVTSIVLFAGLLVVSHTISETMQKASAKLELSRIVAELSTSEKDELRWLVDKDGPTFQNSFSRWVKEPAERNESARTKLITFLNSPYGSLAYDALSQRSQTGRLGYFDSLTSANRLPATMPTATNVRILRR